MASRRIYQITIKGIGYKVEQINTNNLEEYTINYELSDITTDGIIPSLTYNEQDKLVYYLSVFKNLLKASPIKAYDYLSDKEQNKYNSYNHFLNSISNIDRDINTKITSYQKNNNTYIIYTQNKQIALIENELMDFKIEY